MPSHYNKEKKAAKKSKKLSIKQLQDKVKNAETFAEKMKWRKKLQDAQMGDY